MTSRLCAFVLLTAALANAGTFQLQGVDAKAWTAILGSVGLTEDSHGSPQIIVAGSAAPAALAKQAQNQILILEGPSPAAAQFGIVPDAAAAPVSVRQIADIHAGHLPVIWQQPVDLSPSKIPTEFQIFATEKWKGAPLLAGRRTAQGAVLWLAIPPGPTGIERFPYLLHALADLGWSAPAQTTTLWAFFDSAYRIRADPDYLARRWRKAGIGVLHVAAWHNMEPDPTQDDYLQRLIAACHQNAISVYAWFELPHVSEKFWADHPQWREKTAVGQDAQLDWRKLINLQNPACRQAIAAEVQTLLARFDWDGVNLAELYFESLEGAQNPARFTPFNDDVRAAFQHASGFDPQDLFVATSPHNAAAHPESLRQFLDYRAALAAQMQRDWLAVIDQARLKKPYLDTVLTHIDDRFDPAIRDELGADVARSLALIATRHDTLLVEDPAPLWALGPERYARLAAKYRELSPDSKQFAVDINVVERYQDVYPTKKQTGVELFELLHQAADSFGHVALYFENSLEKQDLALLPAAATSAHIEQTAPDELKISAPNVTRIPWQGPVEIDGRPWPVQDQVSLLAPAGQHRISAGIASPSLSLRDFNGVIHSATVNAKQLDLAYDSKTRAIALLNSSISQIQVDGAPIPTQNSAAILLPAGQHLVTFLR